MNRGIRQVHQVYSYYQEVATRASVQRGRNNDYKDNCDHSDDHSDKENMPKRVKKSTKSRQVLKSYKDTNTDKMKQQYRRRYHPYRQHRSNLEIIANILELALTEVVNRNKITYNAIRHKAFRAYEQLSYYLEIMIAKGLLDMDQTE